MFVTIIVLSVVIADIFTKYLTVQLLVPLEREVVVIPHLLNFSYVENRGAAFGILANSRWVFMLLSAILIVVLIMFIKLYGTKNKLFLVSVSLVLGGGIGNMLDRIFLGYVVDFLRVTFIDFPVFNIADSAVVVGTILLIVYFMFFDKSFLAKDEEGKKY